MFNLTLQNPSYLALLGLLIVPIVIHLYHRKKYTKVEFSSLKFLQLIFARRDYFSKIKNILLLIVRCLLIILLTLFLAKPTFKTNIWGLTNKASDISYVVIFDNSLSMNYEEQGQMRRNIAKSLLKKILNSFDETCKGKIIFAPDYKLVDVSDYKIPKIPSCEFDMKKALSLTYQHLKNTHLPTKEVYIISDFQKNNFRKNQDSHYFKNINFYLFDVSKESDWNIFISNVQIDEIIAEGKETKINVVISSYNLKEKKNILVTLNIENIEIETKNVEIYPEKQSIVHFSYKFTTSGHFGGYIKLQDDNLLQDNKYFINFKVIKNISVLCIGESKEDIFYLKYALSPNYPKKDGITIPVPMLYSELNKINLNNFDIVVLSNIQKIDSIIFKNYLRRGGKIIIFLGENINSNSYNKNIFNKIQIRDVIAKTSRLTSINFKNYIFDNFKNPQDANFHQIKFFKYYDISCENDSSVFARFDYKTPAIVEEKINNGKVIVFNTTTEDTFGNFHLTPMFVAILHSTVYYLQKKDVFENYYYIGDKVPSLKLHTEGNHKIIGKEQLEKIISINYKRDESDLSKITQNEIQFFFGKSFKYFKIPSDNLDNIKRSGYKNFSEIIIYVLFVIFLVEILILLW